MAEQKNLVDSYVIRIYRREKDDAKSMVGIVEHVGMEEKTALKLNIYLEELKMRGNKGTPPFIPPVVELISLPFLFLVSSALNLSPPPHFFPICLQSVCCSPLGFAHDKGELRVLKARTLASFKNAGHLQMRTTRGRHHV